MADIETRLAGATKRCPCLYCLRHPGTPRHKPVYFFPDSSGVRVSCGGSYHYADMGSLSVKPLPCDARCHCHPHGWIASKDLSTWLIAAAKVGFLIILDNEVEPGKSYALWKVTIDGKLLRWSGQPEVALFAALLVLVQTAGAEVPE